MLVNEIAPRPHNSGHWTIEGARTSQFENHVRAVLGWPLGPTDLVAPAVTANVLGDVDETGPATLRNVESVLSAPDADLHWYGQDDVYPLRKMGHVTVTAPDADAADDALADSAALEPVGQALADWRDAQARFMAAVDAADASDPATTALLLKTNHGVDASNARCGIPGTDVEGADQPFPLDLTGAKGMLVTQAATEHLD